MTTTMATSSVVALLFVCWAHVGAGNLSGAELGEPRNGHTKQAVLIAEQTAELLAHHASGPDEPIFPFSPH